MIKQEARLLGIDDAPFNRKDENVLVIGVVYRGGSWIEGVMSTRIKRDGDEATDNIARMVKNSRFYNQLKAIFLGGITIEELNVIDIEELSKKTSLPVIAVTRKYPEYEKIFKGLEKLGKKEAIRIVKKTPLPIRINNVFVQWSGCTEERVRELLSLASTHSYMPEPLRAAHLIGAGIMLGESKGRV